MTTGPATSDHTTGSRLTTGRVAPLSPGAAVCAGAVFLLAAFPSSIAGLARLATGASPEALSAGVLVFAGLWAWLALRTSDEPVTPPVRWEVAAAFAALALVALVQWLARGEGNVGPGRVRPDLLMMPVFAGALALLAGGRKGLRRVAGPVALLVLVWPPLAALVAAPVAAPMLGVSRWAGAGIARALGTGVEAVPGVGGLLVCTGRAGVHTISVAPACSGASGVIAVLVATAPVVALAQGSARRKAIWVASGCALVALLAPVRVAVLCHLAANRGAQSAFRAFHILGGTSFFAFAWVAMLALAVPVGLEPPPLVALPGARRLPSSPKGWALLAGAGTMAVLSGVANVRLHARTRAGGFDSRAWAGQGIVIHGGPPPLVTPPGDDAPALDPSPAPEMLDKPRPTAPPEDAPGDAGRDVDPAIEPFNPRRIRTWLARVPGYERWRYRSMPWTRATYGRRSWMERVAYASADGDFYWIDALIVVDPAVLEEHTVHGCYIWHGWTVESWDRREIAPGVATEYVTHVDGDGGRWVGVTWDERAAPGWWLRLNVRRRVGEGETPEAAMGKAAAFAPRLRRGRDEGRGPF